MYLQLIISSTTWDYSAAVKVAIHGGCRSGGWQIQMFEVLLFEEKIFVVPSHYIYLRC